MKISLKRLWAVAVLGLSLSTAYGQTRMLARGGVHISTLAEGLSPELDTPISKVGYVVGLGAEYPIGKTGFRFQPSLNFSQRGYRADYRASTKRRTITTLNYLELPVSLVWASGGEGPTKLYLSGGGYAALGLGGKSKIQDGTQVSTEYNVRFGFEEQRLDYGLTAGAGVQFGFSRIGAFYNHGLANVSKSFPNTRHRVYGVTFTYLFDDIF